MKNKTVGERIKFQRIRRITGYLVGDMSRPLNKIKGSERLVKGSEQTDCLDRYDRTTEPTISKMEQVEDEPQTEREGE